MEKVRDIVGLYLNPPYHTLVLCVDEKSQIQALERTQPNLPMGLGFVEGITYDYTRRGTTTLFAAFDVASGEILAQCKLRHRHQEFLSFLRHIDANVPATLDVHLIADNHATQKHATVKAWLNEVERWFVLTTQRAIRLGSLRTVRELARRIAHFVTHNNATSPPFKWTATTDSILEKLHRLLSRIDGTSH